MPDVPLMSVQQGLSAWCQATRHVELLSMHHPSLVIYLPPPPPPPLAVANTIARYISQPECAI